MSYFRNVNRFSLYLAVTNGIGALTGIAAPVFVGIMTPNVCLKRNYIHSLRMLFFEQGFFFEYYSHPSRNGESFFGLRSPFLLSPPLYTQFGRR